MADKMNPWICRCLQCGKLELKVRPRKGLCPLCGSHCAPALLPSKKQSETLAQKAWHIVPPAALIDLVGELSLVASTPAPEFLSDLSKVGRKRKDAHNATHLLAHRHIMGRPGLANGDLKSRNSLRSALARGESSPFFPRPSLSDSPGAMGKFIEAELGYRASRRLLKVLSFESERLVYKHPVLGLAISVEIDGRAEDLPVEFKTVAGLDRISSKLFGMMMQVSGQAIAKGVDSGILIVAERDGNHITAVLVSGLIAFHLNNITRWNVDARNNEVATHVAPDADGILGAV